MNLTEANKFSFTNKFVRMFKMVIQGDELNSFSKFGSQGPVPEVMYGVHFGHSRAAWWLCMYIRNTPYEQKIANEFGSKHPIYDKQIFDMLAKYKKL